MLTWLEENGYTVNPQKCSWAVQETEFLGHLMTKDGVKPLPKKVQGILAVAKPKTLKQLRGFIGMVNFYCDFWKKWSHIPLTSLTKVNRKQFSKMWTAVHDKAFMQCKAMLARDVLLCYLDLNVPFEIQTDASKLQLGTVILQNGLPVAFLSRKLTPAQQRYPACDLEALCILEVLTEYRTMLYGAQIQVETDHRNLT